MGLFDFFKRRRREKPEEPDYHKEDPWEEEDTAEEEPVTEPPVFIPPSMPHFEEPVSKPDGWPVMEPVNISPKVMQFMQEHTPEEITFAAENAALEGIKAFQQEKFSRAREFFQLGSELGDQKAQAILGAMFIQGYEVPRDLAVGRAWLRRSAEQGNAQAAKILANYVGESEPVAEEVYESSQEAMGSDRKTGVYYLSRAADMGHSKAQYEYGMLLINDEDDEAKGIEWIKRAAFGGYSRAMTYLGNAYLKGDSVPQSNNIALEWFEQAVKKNDPEAQLLLGTMYAQGVGVRQNTETALRLLTLAADAGLSEAKERIEEVLSPEKAAAKPEKTLEAAFASVMPALAGDAEPETEPESEPEPEPEAEAVSLEPLPDFEPEPEPEFQPAAAVPEPAEPLEATRRFAPIGGATFGDMAEAVKTVGPDEVLKPFGLEKPGKMREIAEPAPVPETFEPFEPFEPFPAGDEPQFTPFEEAPAPAEPPVVTETVTAGMAEPFEQVTFGEIGEAFSLAEPEKLAETVSNLSFEAVPGQGIE